MRDLLVSSGLIVTGLVAGPRVGSSTLPPAFEWFDASHPSPNAASEAAGRRALALCGQSRSRRRTARAAVGWRVLHARVRPTGLSLADKMLTARALMNAGAAIAELNCVRKHLSAIKGGRLAACRASNRHAGDLRRSRTNPGRSGRDWIGSDGGGPRPRSDAIEIVEHAGVKDSIPPTVVEHLERGADESPKPGDPRLSDRLRSDWQPPWPWMARRARPESADMPSKSSPRATKRRSARSRRAFAAEACSIPPPTVCVIASGETTVHVRGRGRGGRNQEFALGALRADRIASKHG